jgi:cobalt-zinc-cadmium efflux system membrane fusion protein
VRNSRTATILAAVCAFAAILFASFLAGCGGKGETVAAADAGAPPPAKVVKEDDVNVVKVEHPEQFPLAEAAARTEAPELNVTGTVSADVSKNVPVISLASGRIVEVHARLGDEVTKGQLLLKIQSADIASAFADYRHAVADEVLAKAQYERSKLLFEHGAIAQKDLEVAEDTDAKAKVDVETAREHLRVLGADIDHPSALIEVRAPISGVIVDQQVTTASGTQGLASPNAFTIADLSHVWILCDVYENDLPFVHLGESAEIRLAAYPGRVLKGRIDNIGPTLDPNIRTAKVRIEVNNPGILRLGMFVTATFHGQQKAPVAVVPAAAVLHLHDRDWVYEPLGDGRFRRVEVTAGKMLPGNLQEITYGIHAGDRVVSNALVLQNTAEQ